MNFNSFRKEINSGNASVKELVNEFFLKIDSLNPKINAYTCLTKSIANSQSENIDKLITNNQKLPPLAAIPVAIKDNRCTKGDVTSCPSKMLQDLVSPCESSATGK